MNFDFILCSAIYCYITAGDAFTFIIMCICARVLLLILVLFFCTATYCYVLQLEMHARLICAIKFYLLNTYLLGLFRRLLKTCLFAGY